MTLILSDMALVTICGYPCSGKSYRTEQLRSFLNQRLAESSETHLKLVVISDESLNIKRSVYSDSRTEKPARGALLTALQRHINPNTILIIDAPNYIKGLRYQMYCLAREAKVRVCTVYTISTPEICKERNEKRLLVAGEERYDDATLDNLIMRFEEPNSMVRWDSPLFSVLWTDEDVPGDGIWDVITKGDIKPPNAGTQAIAKAPTDALHTLEHTTQSIVSSIMSEQLHSSSGGPISLSVTPTLSIKIILPPRTITFSELQRLKRQFVTVHKKAITLGTVEKGAVAWDEYQIADKFARYLEENLRS